MGASIRRTTAVGALLAPLVLLLAAPYPGAAVRQLREASSAADPTDPLVAVVSLLAWALAGWLLLTVALTLLARVPGTVGRTAAATVRRAAPAALRQLVAAALGVTVAAGALTASPAAASGGPAAGGTPAAAQGALDWPGSSAPPSLDWPGAASQPHAGPEGAAATDPAALRGAATSTGQAADAVVVEPGDTLWGLAEQALEQRQQTTPTDREVAAAWPAWWSANRGAVGDDPDLLLPGTVLQPPEELDPESPPPSP